MIKMSNKIDALPGSGLNTAITQEHHAHGIMELGDLLNDNGHD